jgi:hypothetical protein
MAFYEYASAYVMYEGSFVADQRDGVIKFSSIWQLIFLMPRLIGRERSYSKMASVKMGLQPW